MIMRSSFRHVLGRRVECLRVRGARIRLVPVQQCEAPEAELVRSREQGGHSASFKKMCQRIEVVVRSWDHSRAFDTASSSFKAPRARCDTPRVWTRFK